MEDDSKVVKRIKEKQTRLQAKKEFQERQSRLRAESIATTKAHYLQEKDNPVVVDILSKAKTFAAWHTKLAQDGVGYRTTQKGQEPELYYYTQAKRVQELDRSAGILELVDYIERQFKDLPEAAKPQTEAEEEPADEETEQ